MKYIFDFDDVLFHTNKKFREVIYASFEKKGISRKVMNDYLDKAEWNVFSLRRLIDSFSLDKALYEEIMSECSNFANLELLEDIKKFGKENCFIVTYGDNEFQMDKITRAGITSLFSEIVVVQGSKKEAVEKICSKYKDETVVFIDDKEKHFQDLDFKKHPNLKTILYAGQKLDLQ